MKIWCLFSVENNYDQPSNNLICWWKDKPSIQTIAEALKVKFEGGEDETIIKVVRIHQGGDARFWNTDYRLEEVEEGIT